MTAPLLLLRDRSTWTPSGPVDVVAVDRFLAGDHTQRLTPAEREVVVHACHAAGVSDSRISDWLHEHERSVRATLAQPAPVDRLGRTFHLTA